MSKKYVKGIVWFSLFILLFIPFVSAEHITIQQEQYLLGSEVFINLNNLQDRYLEIMAPDSIYRYLGDIDGSISFIPSELGEHVIRVRDRESGDVLEAKTFMVVSELIEEPPVLDKPIGPDRILYTNKAEYLVNEPAYIFIDLQGMTEDYALVIRSQAETFKFLGLVQSPVVFVPKAAGSYVVEMKQGTSTIYSIEFSVVSPQGEAFSQEQEVEEAQVILPFNFNMRSKDGLEQATEKVVLRQGTGEHAGEYDLEVYPDKAYVKKIRFNSIVLDADKSFALNEVSFKKKAMVAGFNQKAVSDVFFIDTTGITYSSGSVTKVAGANSRELWKCSHWNHGQEICTGEWSRAMELIPGAEYEIMIAEGASAYAETGVASINTRKPLYHPGENAEVVIVVLDREGYLVSNANIDLDITSPLNQTYAFSTQTGSITMTEEGIYRADFAQTQQEGNYSMFVSAIGENVDYSMLSYFTVKEFYEFDILRDTPVTIDPWQGPFDSSIKVKSYVGSENFNFTEVLPREFTVTDAGGAIQKIEDDKTHLTWTNIPDDSIVSYAAEAPLITPNLFAIGQAFIVYELGLFYEARPWFLAIDPLLQVNASGCSKMVNERADNSYNTACNTPWNIDSEDTNTQDAVADRNKYGGIQTTNDQTLTNCAAVDSVDVCIDWWFTGTVKTCLGVQYSSTGTGGSWTTVSGSSCPTSDGAMICSDVTSGASWTCTSFSSANAAIRAHLRSNTDSAICRADALFFNVTYSAYPDITGSVTNNGPVAEGDPINFTGSCTDLDVGDTFQLVVCNESVATCDETTAGGDLICKGSLGTTTSPSCSYTTVSADVGANSGDKAVCCDADGNCDPTTITISDWVVNSLAGAPTITINSVSGQPSSPYNFTDPTPIVNATSDRDGNCYLSEVDENFTEMVNNGRVNCGAYTKDVAKTCEYTNTLTIGLGTDYLYMACNNTAGGENNETNNADIEINVLCDAHSDCGNTRYCAASNQQCELDELPGYTCEDMAYGGGEDDQVCQSGFDGSQPTGICINDSSYTYTGWYCTADDNDCVFNASGTSYDLGETLCKQGTNDYRNCSASNLWGSLIDCADQFDPYDQSATFHAGEYCAYYATAQNCINGAAGGCNGTATDCTSYIYNQTTSSCGATAVACDLGCGALCDPSNSTTAGIIGIYCYYDKSCNDSCSWLQSQEEAPLFCIDDNDGGVCAYDTRTDPTNLETCYWTQACQDGTGASLSSSGTLQADYCDYCNATGNQTGSYAPAPNASCDSGCANSGTIYYDSGATPLTRNDDCDEGVSTILSDTLAIGDVWNGSAPAYCNDTECDSDCGTLVGVCNVGVCECTDEDYPDITLISPAPDAWINSGTITFNYNVTDLSSAIENCSLVINGSIYQTNSSIKEGLAVQTFSQSLTNATYNWSIRCYDNSSNNNMNQSEGRFVGVDTTDPQLSNANRNATLFNISKFVCINITVTDTYSGVDAVWATIDPPGGNPNENITLSDSQTTSCDQSNGDNVYSVEYELIFSGEYNWTIAYANDSASNTNSIIAGLTWNVSAAGNISVNMTSPVADFEINESGTNNNFTVTCEATCNPGLENCTSVYLFVQYDPAGTFTEVTTITTDLINDENNFSCGDLTQGGASCSHTFNITSGVDSGNNEWPIRCRASSSNSPTDFADPVNVTVNDHPVSVIDSPSDNDWLTGTISINASSSFDSDGTITNYVYEYDKTAAFISAATICDTTDDNCTWNTSQQSICVNNSMGDCYLRVTVTDDNGLTNSTYITIGFDTQGPTVTLGLPADFENITTDSFDVDASAVDSESGTDTVFFEYRENNTASWKSACNDSSFTYQCSWDTSSLPDGNTYEFRAYANDSNGNIGNYDVHTNITIDRQPPQVYLENPQNDNYTSSTTITFYYNVTDVTSDIANCSLIIDGSINQTNDTVQEAQSQSFTTILIEGYYLWSVNCTDIHGFENSSETRNITVDTTGPITILDRPPDFENISGVNYTVNASPSDSGVGNISAVTFEYRKGDSGDWTLICVDDRGSVYDCEWTITGLSDGNDYQVRAYANDSLGNNGSADVHTNITIDNNGPSITLLSPSPGATDGDGDVLFEFTVNDVVSGITNCSLYIDGSLNDTIYAPISEEETQSFPVEGMTNGDYYWNITCWDDFSTPHQNWSETRLLTIDIKYTINVTVNTSKSQYEVGNQEGEEVNSTTNTTDYYNNSLDTNVVTDIIFANTTYPWWNDSWSMRKQVLITESSGSDRTNVITGLSVTGLDGNISSCTNEIRVISLNLTEVPVNILSGDDSTYCNIVFKANVSASASSEELYLVYYDNSGASNPSYPTLTGKYYDMFLDDFNTGADVDPAKWTETGGRWNIEGQRAHADRTQGYQFITTISNLINLSDYDSANVTFDWEVSSQMDPDDCVRLDLYDGSWNDAIWQECDDLPASGTQNIYMGTGYMIEGFQLRYGADTDKTEDQVWIDNVNVSAYSLEDFNLSASTGEVQEHMDRTQGATGIDGLMSFLWNSTGWEIGNYSAVSFATKPLYYDSYGSAIFEMTEDQTPPNVTLNNPENGTDRNSSFVFDYFVDDELSTVANCTLIVDGVVNDTEDVIAEGPAQYFYPRIPSAGWHNWSVNCTDYYGNTGASETWWVWIRPPDLVINSGNITFNNTSPIEGTSITLNATVYNIGGSDAENVTVQFWLGDPDSGGYNISSNLTANITDQWGDHDNHTFNVSWIVTGPGPFTFFVVADPPTATNGSIFELNETNNKANKTLNVPGYSIIYGNVTGHYELLTNYTALSFSVWANMSSGNILVFQSDAIVSFESLLAISRDTVGAYQADDFSDIDVALNMSDFNDSINITYTVGGSPKQITSFRTYDQNITNVPVINSTNTSSFVTGILWDSSDDNPGEYNGSQDLVFITKVNESKTGAYGAYDYELKFPALLRNYKGGGSGTVSYYYEITE